MTTVLEHNSVLRPLYRLEQQGVELSAAGCDALGNVSAQDIESLFQNNTRAVVCTHASNLTGNLTDIREIGRLAHERGILMIDLKTLEDGGTEILTCGTCLNHYGLEEQLAVGEVTNMYMIAETMMQASNIVKP